MGQDFERFMSVAPKPQWPEKTFSIVARPHPIPIQSFSAANEHSRERVRDLSAVRLRKGGHAGR
jgi:hypothetical protein